MPSYRDIILGNPQLGMPPGLVPRLQQALHGWQRRGGAPTADEGSLPLSRDPTRAEIAASANVQQEADAASRPNIMELLLGKLGPSRTMFLGARALHAPVDRMGKAMETMQAGEAPRDVYKATRITKGAEGAPRFEVSDAAARLREGERFDDLYDTEMVSGELADMLKHPELFSNYPELEKYTAILRKGPRGGSFDQGTTFEAAGQTRKEALNSLLHELQHGVQSLEGNARGGSSRMAFLPGNKEAFEILNRIRRDMATPLTEAQYAKQAWNSDSITPDIAKDYRAYLKTTKNIPANIDRQAQKTAAKEYYRRLAGEVESRNTQARQGMSAAERAASFPEDTEDVERALQIIRRAPRL